MNATFPTLSDAVQVTQLPGEILAAFLNMAADSSGDWADDRPDDWLGMLTSGLAGIAAASAVAIMLTVYFRTGDRSGRDIVKHGLAVTVAVALLAFAASDIRHAALAYLGINSAKPAVEFEIRVPKAAVSAVGDAQVELHTDRNQTLAQVQAVLASDDGRTVLRGSVQLDFRTKDRVVILNLPGQTQCQFKLRLAANPSRSDQFGPWHLADRVASPTKAGDPAGAEPNDAFAIRYRVL